MIFDALKRMFGGKGAPEGISCEEALRQLHEFMDGELDTLSCQQVEEHFELCKRCYPHLRLEERFRERIQRALRRDACPESLRQKVLESLVEESA